MARQVRLLKLFAAALLLAAAAVATAGSQEIRYKKFVLVTIDTLRADHLGCYGYGKATSPNIDRFAARAARFERAYSTCSFTCPSMRALHTSRFPGMLEANFANGWEVKPVEAPTIATVLSKRGFKTAAFVGNFALSPKAGLAPGFDVYDANFDSTESNRGFPERTAESLTRAALDWLDLNSGNPFFLWVHYQDPHGPYTAPENFGRRFASEDEAGKTLSLLDNVVGFKGIPSYQKLGDRRDYEYYVAQYDAEVAYMDEHLGRLLLRLEKPELADETVVIFTADHGESLGEGNFYFCHGHGISRAEVHVPLLLYVPGRKPGTSRVPVSGVDIAPTILALAGAERPETFSGKNLVETLDSGKREGVFFTETSYMIGAFEGDWHLSWGKATRIAGRPENIKVSAPKELALHKSPIVLYNTAKDPDWSHDISKDEPEWFRYLRGHAQQYLKRSAEHYKDADLPEPDEATKRALKSLGYMN